MHVALQIAKSYMNTFVDALACAHFLTWPLVGTAERSEAPRKLCAQSAAAIVTGLVLANRRTVQQFGSFEEKSRPGKQDPAWAGYK
jgi:hypothetical protein